MKISRRENLQQKHRLPNIKTFLWIWIKSVKKLLISFSNLSGLYLVVSDVQELHDDSLRLAGNTEFWSKTFFVFFIVMKSTFFLNYGPIRDHKLYVVGMLRNRFCLFPPIPEKRLYFVDLLRRRDSPRKQRLLFGVLVAYSRRVMCVFYHRRYEYHFGCLYDNMNISKFLLFFFFFHLRASNSETFFAKKNIIWGTSRLSDFLKCWI